MKKSLMTIAFLVGFSAQAQESPVATLAELIGENASEAVSGMQLNRLENGNIIFNLCTSTQDGSGQDCSTVTGSPEGYSEQELKAQLRQEVNPTDKAIVGVAEKIQYGLNKTWDTLSALHTVAIYDTWGGLIGARKAREVYSDSPRSWGDTLSALHTVAIYDTWGGLIGARKVYSDSRSKE